MTLGLPDDASVKAGDELVEKAVLGRRFALPALALVDGSRVLVVKEGKKRQQHRRRCRNKMRTRCRWSGRVVSR